MWARQMSEEDHSLRFAYAVSENDALQYGMPRRSGRYPWGSGENPYQHGDDFLSRVEALKKDGWEETPENIRKEFGMSTTEYRLEKSLASNERRMYDVATAKSLAKDGLGATEIARKMSTDDRTVNESTVRSWLNEKSETRMNQAASTAEFLKKQIAEKGMIDVGSGVEYDLGVSRGTLDKALRLLEEEGYPTYKGGIPTGPNKQTTQTVLCPPGTKHSEIYQYDKVKTVSDYTSEDGGTTFQVFQYPESMDSKRLAIRYKEDGGIDKDGVVEIRRGVADLSLGTDRYAQVRILVDGTHYIKGMAVYSDDLPDGVDVVFNTNKSKTTPKMEVLKEIKDDPANPFGSLIKANGQSTYIGADGKEHLSLINKRAGEGDWSDWKNAIPSQFLGKQSIAMAKKQLNLAKADKQAEFDEYMSLTNPTIKKHLLMKFADSCDSAAVHLQAAALPGQRYHVIIPNNTLKETEVYAPGYANGTKLALVRYPHGGIFEIPICTVNNKNATGKKLIGTDPVDAICINSKVAERLSGADFDGDTVMCIPTHDASGKVKVASKPALKGLEGFDPKTAYGADETRTDSNGETHYYRNGREYRVMKATQLEMGKISNLITDMTLAGASDDKVAAAVRHSMVVIDAEKHKLDYKQSEIDNNIKALSKEYQRTIDADGNIKVGGASTLLSRAKGEQSVLKRRGSPRVNIKGTEWYDPSRPEGALLYKTAKNVEYEVTTTNKRTGETTTKTKYRHQQSTNMAETDDAYTLVSAARHPMELVYAEYANAMKSMANQARVAAYRAGKIAYDRGAAQTYAAEVKSLKNKLKNARMNAPKERAAQRRAESVKQKLESTTTLKGDDVKKARQQELTAARQELGSIERRKRKIDITDREWEAIQAGAISENVLSQILANTDVDDLKQRATPRASTSISSAKVAQIKALSASNYSLSEIAKKMNLSPSTVAKYLKGGS